MSEHCYLFLLDISFYIESLKSGNPCQCITRYGLVHFFIFNPCGQFLLYFFFFWGFLFPFFLIVTIYVKYFFLRTLMTFSIFSIATETKPFLYFSSSYCGVNLVCCERLEETTLPSLQLWVVELFVSIIFLSNFIATLNELSSDLGSQSKSSYWLLSIRISMKTLVRCSSRISFTLIFNLWEVRNVLPN